MDSHAAKEVKFTLEVNGIAGLSCGGQERKLAGALGQIIAQKYGNAVEESLGAIGGSNQQVRGSNIIDQIDQIIHWGLQLIKSIIKV